MFGSKNYILRVVKLKQYQDVEVRMDHFNERSRGQGRSNLISKQRHIRLQPHLPLERPLDYHMQPNRRFSGAYARNADMSSALPMSSPKSVEAECFTTTISTSSPPPHLMNRHHIYDSWNHGSALKPPHIYKTEVERGREVRTRMPPRQPAQPRLGAQP